MKRIQRLFSLLASTRAAICTTAILLLGACGGGGGSHAPVTIEVLSNRADLVSGGDALVAVNIPRTLGSDGMRIELEGREITSEFAALGNGRFEALVTGLQLGPNTLTASLPGGIGARLVITNHPNGGPVFSGPQIQPYTCQAGSVDNQCNQPAVYSFLYLPNGQDELQPYDSTNPPTDVAVTTTDQGINVPFIVRQEIGYQNRNQYRVLVLLQPGDTWPSRWTPPAQWNRKVLIPHGAGCGNAYTPGDAPLDDGPYRVLGHTGKETYVTALGRGFAVVSTALGNAGQNCNIALQAESLMMAKEHVQENYGSIRYTIGTGCSGGALVPLQVANAYPGIYDGLTVTCAYADAWSGTTIAWFEDQSLLHLLFSGSGAWSLDQAWAQQSIDAVLGQPQASNAQLYATFGRRFLNPSASCPGISLSQTYHPLTNPGGVRCTITDWQANILGRRLPAAWTAGEQAIGRGFVGLPIGNVGVQYGLRALQDGLIGPAQFVDLNVKIGSRDIDLQQASTRTQADLGALRNAYRSGAINDASRLNQIPIIVGASQTPIHHPAHNAYVIRERIERHGGGHPNYVIWEGPSVYVADTNFFRRSFDAMDRWLAAIEADKNGLSALQRAANNRPADAQDTCYAADGTVLNAGPCSWRKWEASRHIAGAPLSGDVNACSLKPLRPEDYTVQFTAQQWAALNAVFPSGICDYTQPGLAQEPSQAWLTYQDARGNLLEGGKPLSAFPQSTPL